MNTPTQNAFSELEAIRRLVERLAATCAGVVFTFRVARDVKRPEDGRVFIQCVYDAPHSATGEAGRWVGRKWYLSDHMTDDEIVKTCYAAFKAAVEHEVMEGFTWDGHRIFNPHTPFYELMKASRVQAYRPDQSVKP